MAEEKKGDCFQKLFDPEDECCQGCRDSLECMHLDGEEAKYPEVSAVAELTRTEAVCLVEKLYKAFPMLRRFSTKGEEVTVVASLQNYCCEKCETVFLETFITECPECGGPVVLDN